jgi:hypothetical protein
MNASRTPAGMQGSPPLSPRWQVLFNWLALLMLLAGSVVWPR